MTDAVYLGPVASLPRPPITKIWSSQALWNRIAVNPRKSDCGRSLVSLLLVVFILGAMGATVVGATKGVGGGGKGTRFVVGPGSTLGATPAAASGDISATATVSCRNDYQEVSEAEDYYATLNGHAAADLVVLAPLLRGVTSSPYFTFSIVGGQVEVASPSHPATPGDANCDTAGPEQR